MIVSSYIVGCLSASHKDIVMRIDLDHVVLTATRSATPFSSTGTKQSPSSESRSNNIWWPPSPLLARQTGLGCSQCQKGRACAKHHGNSCWGWCLATDGLSERICQTLSGSPRRFEGVRMLMSNPPGTTPPRRPCARAAWDRTRVSAAGTLWDVYIQYVEWYRRKASATLWRCGGLILCVGYDDDVFMKHSGLNGQGWACAEVYRVRST